MNIKLLHRDQIDITQWNARVEESGNGLPYALSEYLDIVTDRQWCALVGDDYEAIFPLPIEYKLGAKMFLQPPFTQQLGLIAKGGNQEILLDFINSIPSDFKLLHLKGNEKSAIANHENFNIIRRTNLLLPLNVDYEEIKARYSKSLRKRIRKNEGYYEIEESEDIDLVVSFYQNEMSEKVGLNSEQYGTARKLFRYLINCNLGKIYIAKYDGDVQGALFVIHFQNRIINLFGTSNRKGKENFAMHLILNQIIEQHSNTETIFDFEGSDLSGVNKFYQSFGAQQVDYPEYYKEQLPLWYKVVKKIKSLVD